MSIPKVIHYCWYGNGSKPECFEKCFASWKKHAPDYEIVEWNESNTNLEENEFMKQAYAAKKYAFVSDIARLRILYDHGGVYLDTDVELWQPLDDLLANSAFFFFDEGNQINTGLGFGTEAHNPLILHLLSEYTGLSFSADNAKKLACPKINTASICTFFPLFQPIDKTQYINDCAFLSSYDYKTQARHHYAFSWKGEEDILAEKYIKKKRKYFKLRRIIRSPNIFDFMRNHRLKRLERLYRFLVYDFLEMGVRYYAYKLYRKIYKKLFHIR